MAMDPSAQYECITFTFITSTRPQKTFSPNLLNYFPCPLVTSVLTLKNERLKKQMCCPSFALFPVLFWTGCDQAAFWLSLWDGLRAQNQAATCSKVSQGIERCKTVSWESAISFPPTEQQWFQFAVWQTHWKILKLVSNCMKKITRITESTEPDG